MGYTTELYLTPTQIFTTKDYIYVSIYEPQGDSKKSGLYRFSKSELPNPTAIEKTNRTEDASLHIVGNTLYTNTNDNATITIFNINGTQRNIALTNGKADISMLEKGIYIYTIHSNDSVLKGKFVKQ